MNKETNEVKKETDATIKLHEAKRQTNESIKSPKSKKQKLNTYHDKAERKTLSEFDIPLTSGIPLTSHSSGGKRKTRKNKRKSNRK